jgi:hypothetical protein
MTINVISPNNTSKWQMGFNSAFKELNRLVPTKIKHKKISAPTLPSNGIDPGLV